MKNALSRTTPIGAMSRPPLVWKYQILFFSRSFCMDDDKRISIDGNNSHIAMRVISSNRLVIHVHSTL